jgi:hypothetical protein
VKTALLTYDTIIRKNNGGENRLFAATAAISMC